MSKRNRQRGERSALQSPNADLHTVTDAIFGDGLPMMDSSYPQTIPLVDVISDDSIQVRVMGLDQAWVKTLCELIENGAEIEPIEVYQQEEQYVLADGFHRVEAYRRMERSEIQAYVRSGGYAGALNRAEEANLQHGLQLTLEDKKHILFRRLGRKHEWMNQSYRQIAAQLGVGKSTVQRWIEEYQGLMTSAPKREATIGGDGIIRKTENIGRTAKIDAFYQKLVSYQDQQIEERFEDLDADQRQQLAELFLRWAEALLTQ